MQDKWPTPVLKRLKEGGIYSGHGIRSVFPSYTYPSHTTMVTGALPIRHGIYYNIPFESQQGRWYWNDSSITAKILWDAAKEADMKTGAVMWPVSVGAPIDYNFPDRWPAENEKGNRFTTTLRYTTPKKMIDNFERERWKKLSGADFISKNHAIDKSIAELSNYIIKNHKPSLMAIHFLGVDHTQHQYGRQGPQVERAIAVVDSLIGEVVQTIKNAGIKDNMVIIITGDHGFANVRTYFAPNVYLAKHGLITSDGWKAKFKGAAAGFLYLKDKNNQTTLDSVKAILSAIPEAQKNLFRILDRSELDKMGVNPNVALILDPEEGVVITSSSKGKPYEKASGKRGTHGFDPMYPDLRTGFIAIGAGIAKHKMSLP